MFANNMKIKNILKYIDKPLSVLDIETTSLDVNKDQIVQFAAIKLDPNGNVDRFETKIKPSIPIDPEASEVHGIYDKDLEKEKPFAFYAKDIYKNFIKGCYIAGYNAINFDLLILNRQLEESGVVDAFKHSYFLDAFLLFKLHNARSLGDALRFYTGKEIKNAHDALADVEATVDIINEQFARECRKIQDISSELSPPPDKRVGMTNHIIMDDDNQYIINFGNHKGTKLRNVPHGYLSWIAKSDFPKEVKAAVENVLDKRC